MFLKLDIVKAFDFIRWDYLLSLLQHMGFPMRWRDWIVVLLSTSSSRVLLNEVPNPPLMHDRGLRQGDPLSPLLFVTAINPLQRLLQLASEMGILSKLRGRAPYCRISMYADDATMFIAPIKEEIDVLVHILNMFGGRQQD